MKHIVRCRFYSHCIKGNRPAWPTEFFFFSILYKQRSNINICIYNRLFDETIRETSFATQMVMCIQLNHSDSCHSSKNHWFHGLFHPNARSSVVWGWDGRSDLSLCKHNCFTVCYNIRQLISITHKYYSNI